MDALTRSELERIGAKARRALVGGRDLLRIRDMVSSWWAVPACVYDANREWVYTGGSTRGGATRLGIFDLRSQDSFTVTLSSDERVQADDHYTPAILNEAGKNLMAMGSFHDETDDWRLWSFKNSGEPYIANAEQTIAIPDVTDLAYGQIIRRPDTNANMLAALVQGTKGGTSQWYLCRSADYGATWSDAEKMLLHSYRYQTWKRSNDGAGNTGFFVASQHPTSNDPQVLKFFKCVLTGANGTFQNAAGTGLLKGDGLAARMWGTAPATDVAMLNISGADTVSSMTGDTTRRLLDVSSDGNSIAVVDFSRANPGAGGEYKVLRRQASAATNTWAAESLGQSGVPFGYDESCYVGGVHFEGLNAALVVQEASGTWTLERWARTGTDFGSGTWALDEIVYTAPSGRKLGRPRVPTLAAGLAAGSRIAVVGEYTRYATDTFTDFMGDQILLRY